MQRLNEVNIVRLHKNMGYPFMLFNIKFKYHEECFVLEKNDDKLTYYSYNESSCGFNIEYFAMIRDMYNKGLGTNCILYKRNSIHRYPSNPFFANHFNKVIEIIKDIKPNNQVAW